MTQWYPSLTVKKGCQIAVLQIFFLILLQTVVFAITMSNEYTNTHTILYLNSYDLTCFTFSSLCWWPHIKSLLQQSGKTYWFLASLCCSIDLGLMACIYVDCNYKYSSSFGLSCQHAIDNDTQHLNAVEVCILFPSRRVWLSWNIHCNEFFTSFDRLKFYHWSYVPTYTWLRVSEVQYDPWCTSMMSMVLHHIL